MSSPHWARGCLLGEGSFGKVYLAIKTDSGELFAVKSVNCSDPRRHAEVLAMENELNVLQELDCPRIIKCLGSDFTVENGVRVRNLFMEYMAGGSLADLLHKFGGQLHENVVGVYACSILEGLQYLHSHGVVHCDIKGKNILIGSGGDVKIADFGSARQFSKSTVVENVGGTPLWMAPEVIKREEQGPASDIWSFGCTIMELLTWAAAMDL